MELEWEQVDSVIKQELKTQLSSLREDLQKNLELGDSKVFDYDPVKDRAMIREHIHAFSLVLKYMTGTTDETDSTQTSV